MATGIRRLPIRSIRDRAASRSARVLQAMLMTTTASRSMSMVGYPSKSSMSGAAGGGSIPSSRNCQALISVDSQKTLFPFGPL